MVSSLVASAALFASSVVASGLGSAVIVNNCDYQVHLCAVPAAGGGQTEVDQILKTGDTFSQTWTPLTNTMGWSIKLSKTEVMRNIMQYEYTYHSDNIIWYDMSEVDGNPWRGNFMITAKSDDNSCKPRQAAYRYSDDDAYGMQDCAANSVITLTLCSGDNATTPDAGSYGSAPQAQPQPQSSSSAPAAVQYTTQAAPPPAPSPSFTSIAQPSSQAPASSSAPVVVAAPASSSHSSSSQPAPTPSSYVVTAMPIGGGGDGVWTTFETVTQTDYVTLEIDTTVTAYATGPARKRHEHHPGRRGAHN